MLERGLYNRWVLRCAPRSRRTNEVEGQGRAGCDPSTSGPGQESPSRVDRTTSCALNRWLALVTVDANLIATSSVRSGINYCSLSSLWWFTLVVLSPLGVPWGAPWPPVLAAVAATSYGNTR